MAGSSIFVTYGLKAGGGLAFLKRTRTAFGQGETQTRTASSTRQKHTSTGQTFTQSQTRTMSGWATVSCVATASSGGWGGWIWQCGNSRTCVPGERYTDCPGCVEGWWNKYCTRTWYNFSGSTTVSWNSYWNNEWNNSGWSNVGSCSAGDSLPSSTGTATRRECRGVSSCRWINHSGWFNSACTPSGSCSNGSTLTQCRDLWTHGTPTDWLETASCSPTSAGGQWTRQCRTVAKWGEYTSWEEAESCDSSTPSLNIGATQIQCMAN